jgi:tetratricopeptide (TPR) repeat protein
MRPALLVLALALTACGAEPTEAPTAPPQPKVDLPAIRALWDFGDPQASEKRFRDLLAQVEGKAPPAYVAEVLTQLARSEGLQQRFDAADATLDRAAPLITDAAPRARVLLLLERGRVRNSSKRQAEALPLFEQAYVAAEAAGLEALAVDAAHMAAIASQDEVSLAWNLKALARAEASKEEAARGWRASLLNNIGWTHHGAKRYEQALGFFERALAVRLEKGPGKDERIARWCVARCLRSLGRTQEALERQQALEKDAAAAGTPDGFVFEELAECLWALDRKDEARPWFAQAHALLVKDIWLARDESARLERLARLAGGAVE